MNLVQILALAPLALAAGWLLTPRQKTWAAAGISLLALFWLQSASAVRGLDYWLPSAAAGLSVLVWALCQPKSAAWQRSDLAALAAALAVILLIALNRYLPGLCCLTASRPPAADRALVGMLLLLALSAAAWRQRGSRYFLGAAGLLLILIFIFLKSEPLACQTSAWLRALTDQDISLAATLDLRWLGYSYLAFRLLHVLRDTQNGKSTPSSLPEFLAYALFFPAYTAGPIDRLPRFLNDLRQTAPDRGADVLQGSQRLLVGAFKKFVLADTLALMALNPQNALQVQNPFWMWVLLYAYALRLYFDFSGYTDIAIGLGRWLGIRLPENFEAPYFKTNLTAFWNSWHITLAQWLRAYFFNPLTRYLRTHPSRPPAWLIILVGQTGVMLLLGLWHGITWNFAAWGLWHALGLFGHNRWVDWRRRSAGSAAQTTSGWRARLGSFGAWLVTFHYVSLGWVLFAMPDLELTRRVFQVLFGL